MIVEGAYPYISLVARFIDSLLISNLPDITFARHIGARPDPDRQMRHFLP